MLRAVRAMVLAAGFRHRLRPLTDERTKLAVPVANRPLAWFALDHLARGGNTRGGAQHPPPRRPAPGPALELDVDSDRNKKKKVTLVSRMT